MYLSTFQVLYKLYLSTDVLKYKVLLPGSGWDLAIFEQSLLSKNWYPWMKACTFNWFSKRLLHYLEILIDITINTKKETWRTTPIFRPVTFLVAPSSDPYIIVELQIESPSAKPASTQSQWRVGLELASCWWRTSMIMNHLLHTGHQASFVTTNPFFTLILFDKDLRHGHCHTDHQWKQ